jgi:hypothetical protein
VPLRRVDSECLFLQSDFNQTLLFHRISYIHNAPVNVRIWYPFKYISIY